MLEILREEERARLEKAPINDLRALGKNLLIKCPTALSKPDLIEEILTVIYGEVVPTIFETRGRPNKEAGEYEVLSTKEYSTAMVASGVECYEIVGKKIISDEINYGFVSIAPAGSGWSYIDSGDKKYRISESIIKAYALRQGDYVGFTCVYSFLTSENVLSSIVFVNGIKADSSRQRIDFSTLSPTMPTHKFDFSGGNDLINVMSAVAPITIGGRVLFIGNNTKTRIKIVKDLIASFQQSVQDIVVLPLVLEYPKEIIKQISKEESKITATSHTDSDEEKMDKILSAFFKAQRFVEVGSRVVLIVDSLDDVYECMSECFTDQNKRDAVKLLSKLFNYGSPYSNGGSLTICAIASETCEITEKMKKIATLVVPLNNELDQSGIYPPIDIGKIESKIDDMVLEKDEVNTLEQLRSMLAKNSMTELQKALDFAKRKTLPSDLILKLKTI